MKITLTPEEATALIKDYLKNTSLNSEEVEVEIRYENSMTTAKSNIKDFKIDLIKMARNLANDIDCGNVKLYNQILMSLLKLYHLE